MKKNQQYHSNDLLMNVSHDDVVYKANRRCSNYSATLGRKDMDAMLSAKKLRNSQTCRNFDTGKFNIVFIEGLLKKKLFSISKNI